MQLVIIGAGISGLLSAYYALENGASHITILESASHVAAQASGANAAQLSYSYVNPLGQPWVLKSLPQLILGQNKGLRIERFDVELALWGVQFLTQCTEGAFIKNRNKLLELSFGTQKLLPEILNRTGLSLHRHSHGKLHLFHTDEGFEDGKKLATFLQSYHSKQTILSQSDAAALVPAMNVGALPFAGALFAPDDETADCAAFCRDMADYLARSGKVAFRFNASVRQWRKKGARIEGAELNSGDVLGADKFLVCTGSGTNALLKSLHLSFPLYPIKGYTLEFDADGMGHLPHAVTDHAQKVVFVPYGNRVLVSGMFHMAGHNLAPDKDIVEHIRACAKKRLPALNTNNFELRIGLRPCTPDAQPIIRKAGFDNLFVNIGQGGYGWTLSASTAKRAAVLLLNHF